MLWFAGQPGSPKLISPPESYLIGAMRAVQRLLFADPQPLVERLGADFFKNLPEVPGVYLMRDGAGAVLYVGKAKNLRKRLNSYRVANPDRLPRRHLRLLRSVASVEWRKCADEAGAIRHEAELLRTLRPKFNRAGTWPAPPRFLACDHDSESILLRIVESPELGWRVVGPLGGGAMFLRAALARLLWFAACPQRGISALPIGWIHGRLESETAIHCGPRIEAVAGFLGELFSGKDGNFRDWIRTQMPDSLHPFDRSVVEADLEFITDSTKAFTGAGCGPTQNLTQST